MQLGRYKAQKSKKSDGISVVYDKINLKAIQEANRGGKKLVITFT